jgi:hypothetical protein
VGLPYLLGELNKLQHFMNQIKKMSTDSCSAAKSLVNSAGEAMGMWQMQNAKHNMPRRRDVRLGLRLVELLRRI